MTALAGAAVGVAFRIVAVPSMLVQSGHSRQFGTEADDDVFAHPKRHGVSPRAFADALRRQQKEAAPQSGGAVLR